MMTTRKKTTVETRTSTITPIEEKVVRMRHGLRAPDTLALGQVGQEHPETQKMLADIEARAIAAVAARSTRPW